MAKKKPVSEEPLPFRVYKLPTAKREPIPPGKLKEICLRQTEHRRQLKASLFPVGEEVEIR
jgi:hypothetical protein